MNTPTPEELEYLRSIERKRKYGRGDREEMYRVYNRIFSANKRPTTCGSCLYKTHSELMQILKQYNNES